MVAKQSWQEIYLYSKLKGPAASTELCTHVRMRGERYLYSLVIQSV